MKKFKIVILGAGAAGYFTAAALKKNLPNVDVSVIFDPSQPNIGVGESLGWNAPHFFREILGLTDEHQWMKDTGSSYKWGIAQVGFDGTQEPYYFTYGFNGTVKTLEKSVLESKLTDICHGDDYSLYDIWLHLYGKGLRHKQQNQGDLHELHYYAKLKKSPFNKNLGKNACEWINHSYHINSNTIGQYVHEKVGKPAGVKTVPVRVKEVVLTSDGQNISNLILENDEIVEADMFVDCTGLQRVLVSKLPFIFEPCNSYFNNAALVGPYFYNDHHDTCNCDTELKSMPYGWSFTVPMDNRSGNGYIFNRDIFNDKDQLISQHEELTGKKNVLSRLITWDPGYYRDAYVGNCIALGISHGFVDAFDANHFTGTMKFIQRLLKHLKDDENKTLEWKNDFNYFVYHQCEDVKFRIECAFHLSPRNDTNYWELMKEAAKKSNTLEKIKQVAFSPERKKYQGYQNVFYTQSTFINTMLYYNIPFDLPEFPFTEEQEELALNFFDYFNKKNYIQAKNAEPMSEFYKKNIFKDIKFTPGSHD